MALASRPTRSTRRPGRRWLLLGILVTVVVLVVTAAISARSPAPARQLAEQSYLDQVLPIIQDSTQQGRAIEMLRSQATQASQASQPSRASQPGSSVVDQLDPIVGGAQQSSAAIRRIEPPKSMESAHDLLLATLTIRADGAQALRQALATALGGQPIEAAINALAGVGGELETSDRTYALFAKAVPTVGAAPPPSQWVTDPSAYDSANLGVFLTTVRSAASLAPVHDVAVVLVSTDPAAVSLNGATQILPTAKFLNLQIVVADTGNQAEKNLMVTATIAPSAIGPSQMLRDFVDLTPGQRQTVSLGGLRVQPGQPTTLTARIEAAPGETNLADNTKTITLVMS